MRGGTVGRGTKGLGLSDLIFVKLDCHGLLCMLVLPISRISVVQ